jgi:hypothetical protein
MVHIGFLLLLVLLLSLLPEQSFSQEDEEYTIDVLCTAESAALNSDPDVAAAVEAFRAGALAELPGITDFCNVLRRSCTVDLSDYSTEYRTACEDAGGQIATRDTKLDCTGKIAGVPIPGGFDVYINKFPACVGSSCETDGLSVAVDGVIEASVTAAEEEVKQGIESAIEDGSCSGGIQDAGEDGTSFATALSLHPLVLAWVVSLALFSFQV